MGESERCVYTLNGAPVEPEWQLNVVPGESVRTNKVALNEGDCFTVDKIVCLVNSLYPEGMPMQPACLNKIGEYPNFDALIEESKRGWDEIWDKADIRIVGDRFA